MPRYFFDVHQIRWDRDDTGTDCTDIHHAIRQARRTLPALFVDRLPQEGDHHTVTMLIRDEDGQPVYKAALAFNCLLLDR